jgi:hypothetical protein
VGFNLNKSLRSSSIVDDIRFALSSRFVMTILTISTVCRIIFNFFVLPSSPSGFGPDEGTYAALAKYVAEGRPVEEFPLYGAGLYHSAKSIILPSAFLAQLGMGELGAVRTISSTYGLASSLVLALCFLALLRLRNQTFQKSEQIFDRKFLILLSIFTFFPSNFIWSTIGLRESGNQFWLMTTFYLILKLLDSAGRDSLKFTALCSLALTLAYGTRPETSLVFSIVALLASIVLLLKIRKFLPLFAIFLGVFGGQAFTTTPQVVAKESLGAFKIIEPGLIQGTTPKPVESNQGTTPKPVESIQGTTPKPVESNQGTTPKPVESNQGTTPKPVEILEAKQNDLASLECFQVNEIIQFDDTLYRCKSTKTYQAIERNLTKTLEDLVLTTQVLESKRNANTVDAQSALPANDCQGPSRDISRLIECNLNQLPYRLFAFLFRPLIFFDQGSSLLNFAALENVAWLLFIPLSVWVSLLKTNKSINRMINLSLISYVIVFASAASLYEGNLGTAFRHKSTILWPLVFILMITPNILSRFKTFNRFA